MRAAEERVSAMPLHYAIRALLASALIHGEPTLDALLTEVEQYLQDTERDKNRRIQRNIEKIRQKLAASNAERLQGEAEFQG
jgi:hypothetical protein